MNLLRRFLAFLTRRPQQPAGQPTQEAHPQQQAAPSIGMFHGVGTLTIIGGTFIVIGKRIAGNRALLDKY